MNNIIKVDKDGVMTVELIEFHNPRRGDYILLNEEIFSLEELKKDITGELFNGDRERSFKNFIPDKSINEISHLFTDLRVVDNGIYLPTLIGTLKILDTSSGRLLRTLVILGDVDEINFKYKLLVNKRIVNKVIEVQVINILGVDAVLNQ